jgi:hypothetical protein
MNLISNKQLPSDWKVNVSVSFVQKCVGASNGMVLNVYPAPGNLLGSYSFAGEDGSASSGTGSPSPDQVAAFAAYEKLKPSPQVLAHCDSLKARSASIKTRPTDLSKQALVLSEGTVVLRGVCQFLKFD